MRRRLNSRSFEPFDDWLFTLGLYRKRLPKDGSCLFRAVAEQIFMTQTQHERVRELCLEYMSLHREEFEPFLDIPLDHHVFTMRDIREWGGHLEIMAMSRLFNVNFLIYREIGKEPYKATENGGRTIMLSYTHGNHYDIVYSKEFSSSRGFCQSMIYDILYSHVFKLKDVQLAVDTMLHDKEYASFRRDSDNSSEFKEIGAIVERTLGMNISRDSQDEADKNVSTEEKLAVEDIHEDDVRGLLEHNIPPFPYKVAKSLDPDLYRNIEYDTWSIVRREAWFGPYDYNGFHAGVKVLIKLDQLPNRQEVEDMRKAHLERTSNGDLNDFKGTDEKVNYFHGHIQEMSENKGPVEVYIEEIAFRLKVPYEALERLPHSSPHTPGRSEQQHQPSGSLGGGGVMPSYKKLTGYYQKAPLENEFAGSKRKSKGKPARENSGQTYAGNTRGGYHTGSPTAISHSPKSRTPDVKQSSYNRNATRGIGRGNMRNSDSPPNDDFPSINSGTNAAVSLEGVWGVRPDADQPMAFSTPQSSNTSCYQATPHSTMGKDESCLQIQALTDVLHQVMSVGGQIVQVSGQQLEVVNGHYSLEDQSIHGTEKITSINCNASSSRVDEEKESSAVEVYNPSTNGVSSSPDEVGMVTSLPQFSQSNDSLVHPSFYPPDQSIAYMSTPPPSVTQIEGCSSPQSTAMYAGSFPPYANPTYVQMVATVPPSGGIIPQPEVTPPSSSGNCRPDSVGGSSVGSNAESVNLNTGMTPVMVYQVPVLYGGYGGYNQPIPYVPVLSPPCTDDGSSPPIPGCEMYPQMIPVSGWGPPMMGDWMPPPPMTPPPPIPPQYLPPSHPESVVPQYPPPQSFHERPPHHDYHHFRGRGRGGHHNSQGRGGGGGHNEGAFRGGNHRPLPPRLRRGGGPPRGRGGMMCLPPHMNNNSPAFNVPYSHQFEGQPLMQMGSRKNLDNLAVNVSPPDNGQYLPQEQMMFYPTPPGYMMGPQWM